MAAHVILGHFLPSFEVLGVIFSPYVARKLSFFVKMWPSYRYEFKTPALNAFLFLFTHSFPIFVNVSQVTVHQRKVVDKMKLLKNQK